MNVKSWSEDNNLKLNCTKSKEIVFTGRGSRNKSVTLPPPCLGICQVRSITALGVVLNDKLTATDHVSPLLTSCLSSLYAMRVLRDHGLPAGSLQDVFRATVIAKLTYGAPAGRAFARRATVRDWTLSCGAPSDMVTVLKTLQQSVTCLLLLMNLCSSVYSTMIYTYCNTC